MVLLSGDDEQKVGVLKGVDRHWFDVSNMDSFIDEGSGRLENDKTYTPAVVGWSIAAALGINVENVFSSLAISYPRPGANGHFQGNAEAALNSIVVKPDGYSVSRRNLTTNMY